LSDLGNGKIVPSGQEAVEAGGWRDQDSRRVRPRIYATRPRPANPTTNLRLQGIAAALGNRAGAQMGPDLAALVLDSPAITVTDLEAAGADPYDLEPLTAIPRCSQ
jgi:hypothetical protein